MLRKRRKHQVRSQVKVKERKRRRRWKRNKRRKRRKRRKTLTMIP